MLDNSFHEVGYEVPTDLNQFLSTCLISLVNALHGSGISDRSCRFFENDIYIFVEDNITILFFSRDRKAYRKVLGVRRLEKDYEDALMNRVSPDLKTQSQSSAILLHSGNFKDIIYEHQLVDPAVIAFPTSFFEAVSGHDKEFADQVAEVLVPAVQEDEDRDNRIVRINPMFNGRDFTLEPLSVFMLMAFEEPYNKIYRQLIKPVVTEEGFTITRSDDIFSDHAVIEDIWESINRSRLIIAEISSNNPNVMYELGIAHTVGKEVMMITQDTASMPFNFKHLRCYPYTDDIAGGEELKRSLRGVLRQIKSSAANDST